MPSSALFTWGPTPTEDPTYRKAHSIMNAGYKPHLFPDDSSVNRRIRVIKLYTQIYNTSASSLSKEMHPNKNPVMALFLCIEALECDNNTKIKIKQDALLCLDEYENWKANRENTALTKYQETANQLKIHARTLQPSEQKKLDIGLSFFFYFIAMTFVLAVVGAMIGAMLYGGLGLLFIDIAGLSLKGLTISCGIGGGVGALFGMTKGCAYKSEFFKENNILLLGAVNKYLATISDGEATEANHQYKNNMPVSR